MHAKFLKFFSSLFFLVFIQSICVAQNCKELPTTFKSYSEAINQIESAKFLYADKISGNFSSWIDEANYYSCNKQNGFLMIETSKQKYVHKNVPINVWSGFKTAKSKGSYYTKYIKGRYRLQLVN